MARAPTSIWCPECEEITPCRSVTRYTADAALDTVDFPRLDPGRRYLKEYPDLQFFRRWRQCDYCKTVFTTVEIREEVLHELGEYRNDAAVLADAGPILKKLRSLARKADVARHARSTRS